MSKHSPGRSAACSTARRAGRSRRARAGKRRGAIVVLFSLLLVLLVVAVVYAIDISRMQLTRAELRAATDAAARAGAEALLRTRNEHQARQAAKDFAQAHAVAGEPLQLASDDITLGRCRSHASQPWVFVPGEQPYNAVRVAGRRTAESVSGPVDLFLGAILGAGQFEPTQVAIAAQGAQHFSVVIESSGSMHAPERWSGVHRAIDGLGQALARNGSNASLCLIECKNQPQLLLPLPEASLSIEETMQRLNEEVDQMRLRQSRNLGGGLLMASDTLEAASPGTNTSRRILFVGNGNHNNGVDPVAAAKIAASRRQVIYSILVGHNADKKGLMAEAVRITGGKQFHIDDHPDLAPALDPFVKSTAVITVQ